jgi:predicted DNA-binding protein
MMYNSSMETKQATSIRLTPEAKRLLRALARRFGVSMTAMLELMIREKAQREGVS